MHPINKLKQMTGLAKAPHEAQPEADDDTGLDVIFSCCVCNATFSEAYERDREPVQMLSDGINTKDRPANRLFLASCCHLFCGKHLEGGGAPFHPVGRRPRVPCPVCAPDAEPVDLYSVRGFNPGEYDDAIPACFFAVPPVKLDSQAKDMQALRFQYVSLITYGKQITSDKRRLNRELDEARTKLSRVEMSASEAQDEVKVLEQENQRLRASEQELQRLKQRMPDIQRYLKVLPKLVEQRELMNRRLASLGFQMHLEPIQCDNPPHLSGREDEADDVAEHAVDHSRTASDHTGHRSAETLVNPDAFRTSSPHTRPLKRQRVDSPLSGGNIHVPTQPQRVPGSRDRMPPPLKSLSRIKSMKKFLPHLRKKGSNVPTLPVVEREFPSDPRMQMSEMTVMPDENRPTETVTGYTHYPVQTGDREGGAQFMTGALPLDHNQLPAHLSQHSSSIGLNGGSTEFSFRSPIESHSTRPLPNEPSYIHLMDPLSHDTGLDLGLSDPRGNLSPQANHESAQYAGGVPTPMRPNNVGGHGRWDLGHAFLHQSPNGPSPTSYRHPDPLRSNPTAFESQRAHRYQSQNPVTPAPRRSYNSQSINPITPALQRSQQPAQMEESVVSPFFKSSNRNSQIFSGAGVNERDDSFRHFDGYPSQNQRMSTGQTITFDPHGLNGLSFFDSPLNTRNEPITHEWAFAPPSQRYALSNVTSSGFIKRPNCGRLPPLNESTSARFEREQYPQHTLKPTHNMPSFSSSTQQPYSRVEGLPLSVPSNISSQRSSKRPRAAVPYAVMPKCRPSQLPRSHMRSSAFSHPTRELFSSNGRRSVRR